MVLFLLGWVSAVTVLTFAAFGFDKLAAKRDHARFSERTLLALVAVGGTVGALIAMPVFRHKTAKTSFRWKLAGVLALQAAVIGAVIWLRHEQKETGPEPKLEACMMSGLRPEA